ncbi:MAG: hypothetical protein AB7T06_15285 [Kofleriaceae bacterium]
MTDQETSDRVPSDQGLTTLGLLMQLGGTIFAAYGALMLLFFVFLPLGRPGDKGLLLLLVAVSIGRSAFHRMAGSELLYGHKTLDGVGSPLTGVRRYIVVALAQSAIVAVLLKMKFHVATSGALGLGLGLAAWPILLAVLFALPRFKRFATEIPVPEDKGFEGVSIVMTMLGLCGALGTGAFLVLMLQSGGAIMSQGPGVLLLVALVMLLVRSIFHVQAGLSGLRETSLEMNVEKANRYANFGVIASFCASGALLIVMITGIFNIILVALVAGVCWLLMAWPLIIRRFYGERQFADLMAGDGATHRRSPDAGLTGLGWFLLANAMLGATMLIPQLIGGREVMGMEALKGAAFMGPVATKSLWFNAGMIAFQGWAGYELVRMSGPSRMIAIAYAVIVGALSVWLMYPMLQQLSKIGRHFAPESVTMFIPIAFNLVVPVATLLLVTRKTTPVATARFVSKPPSETPAA